MADFKQPVGMNLKEGNQWAKKAQMISWREIGKRCVALYTNRKGNIAKPLQLALGACIIQTEYGYSDTETILQIKENPYLQYFSWYPSYDDEKLPFDSSLMVYFRKRLTPEILGKINEDVVRDAKERQGKEDTPAEFGIKLNTSVTDRWTQLGYCSFDAYHKARNLQELAERLQKREVHYPRSILAGKIYRNRRISTISGSLVRF